MPFIIGKIPRGTVGDEQTQLLDTLENLIQDAVAVMPNDSQVEILNNGMDSKGGRHHELIDRCNSEIALALLGQTLTTEVGSNGSYAASKTHNEVRGDIVTADKRMVERAVQQLVNWIYEINWGPGKAPAFYMWHDTDVDKELAERDHILTQTGIKFAKDYYVRTYGLDSDDFEVAGSAPGAEFAEAEGGKGSGFNPNTFQLDNEKLSQFGKQLLRTVLTFIREGK